MSSAPFPLLAYPLPENIRRISKSDQIRERLRTFVSQKNRPESKKQQQFIYEIHWRSETKNAQKQRKIQPRCTKLYIFSLVCFPESCLVLLLFRVMRFYFKLIHTHSPHTLASESPNNIRWIIVSCFPFLTIKQHFQVRIDESVYTRIPNRYNRFRSLC